MSMYRQMHRHIFVRVIKNLRSCKYSRVSCTEIKEEVKQALTSGKPVVALESTIITHGMPFPKNVECALEVEDIIREQGATPATIAIINGTIKVGLSRKEIELLGDTHSSKPIKTSRRDFPYVLSTQSNGGTTVSGTLIVAKNVGISVFATGGIGGVHRGASETFDISADLIELEKSNVAVVSSGVKSILDIPKTLEYLETHGVFVATIGPTLDFPAFYSSKSGCKAPYCVEDVERAARIIKSHKDLNLQSGLLFGVPVPEQYSIEPEIINDVIEKALKKADGNVFGKDVTPYLLSQVAQITQGKSLQTNIALIKNNARIAAKIAVALSEIEERLKGETEREDDSSKGRPVIIGGSNLDCCATLETPEIK